MKTSIGQLRTLSLLGENTMKSKVTWISDKRRHPERYKEENETYPQALINVENSSYAVKRYRA